MDLQIIKFNLLGAALLVVTVIIHAWGTTAWLKHLTRDYNRTEGHWHKPVHSIRLVSVTVLVLLALHVAEIEVWALAYRYLVETEEILVTFEEATYFSFVTFTTLGYGDITLDPPIRILSGIQALNGIILGGWSTAMLFAVVQRTWQDSQYHDEQQKADSETGNPQ